MDILFEGGCQLGGGKKGLGTVNIGQLMKMMLCLSCSVAPFFLFFLGGGVAAPLKMNGLPQKGLPCFARVTELSCWIGLRSASSLAGTFSPRLETPISRMFGLLERARWGTACQETKLFWNVQSVDEKTSSSVTHFRSWTLHLWEDSFTLGSGKCKIRTAFGVPP